MTPSDAFDDVHRLSFGYSFGSGPSEKKPEPKKPEERPVPPAPTGPPVIVQAKPEPPKAVKAPAEAPKPTATAASSYAIILPGFQTKEGAQGEMKALELLGFSTKHAQISRDPKRGGWVITLARLNSKVNADAMAASLMRMSFRANVELVEQ
jgi:cell division protein FtsN